MSLVGSLEDLGLGDILQIIHLSRKSGVLLLRSERGEGQVLFHEGLIRGAFLKGGPTELRELLGGRPGLDAAALDAAWQDAHARGASLADVLCDRGLLDEEALDTLRRENVESAVIRMFGWPTGEFSFEVREMDAASGEDLCVTPGLNPQFLALEGTRQIDEAGHAESDDEPIFDGEPAAEAPFEAPDDAEASAAWGEVEAEPPLAVAELAEADDAELPMAALALDDEPKPVQAAALEARVEPGPTPGDATPPPVVAIDSELPVLEWVKGALADVCPRVHIFQHSDLGISRIRQYLARREMPLVLIARDAPADPLSGARDTSEIVRRLRAQAPRMPVLVLLDADDDPESAATVVKPSPTQLADPRAVAERERCADGLRDAIRRALSGVPRGGRSGDPVAELREISARLRDPASRGEVLPQVLAFAARQFGRVAMFMVREGRVHGLAQVGLPRAGGPGDAALRDVELPAEESAWLRRVIESRHPSCAPPADEGDHRLAVLLGNTIPEEAYVAPLESGDEIVALLYADNLPGGGPIGDTRALEVVLHEAGLALDRAVLERALEEAQA